MHKVRIHDLSYLGYGVTKVAGMTVFVEKGVPEDVLEIEITDKKKNYAFAKIVRIVEPSSFRVTPVDGSLDTMPIQHIRYDKQLEYKRTWLIDTLKRNIDLSKVEIQPTLGMDNPWQYRNKAQVPVRMVDNQLDIGIFKVSSNEFIPVENFYIQDKEIDLALISIRDILRNYGISAYDPETNQGLIKHLIIRKGHYTHELMIILVTTDHPFPFENEIVQDILSKIPNTVGIIQNINPKNKSIMGHNQRILFGVDAYLDEIGDYKFMISSKSFFQVNSIQTEKLYKLAIEAADIKEDEIWLDAYCGIGTLTHLASSKAKHVYGIEVVEDAIKMANLNKEINQVKNISFEIGKAEDVIQSMKQLDGVIVDPPRAGLDEKFIQKVLKIRPKKFVYVSCNPITLSKDLKLLSDVYSVEYVQPVDMFPHTLHVETVVLMSRVEK